MKSGQIAQLQELGRCWNMRRFNVMCIEDWLEVRDAPMDKIQEAWLRRLWHLYRHQVAAMKRNRVAQ